LEEAYARVAEGAVEIVFLAGPSGVGKSALMQVLCERVRISQGIFASGKFDELQRGTPYFGISQALRSIIRRKLADSKEQLAHAAEVFRNAVGPNARALVDMIPELAHILGETPPLVEVGPVEAQNRFRHTLQCFLRAIATREHPLVLCVDDLQWADSGSISLLHSILTDRDLQHLLLIGTYREHDVEGAEGPTVHWLGRTVAESGTRVQTLSLTPLGNDALSCIAANGRSARPKARMSG
jgi:predicted ATPase